MILKIILIFLFSFSVFSESKNLNRKEVFLNRFQLANTLAEKFGPNSKPIIEKYIFSRPSIFYGPCDIYGQVYKKEKDLPVNILPSSTCYSGLTENKITLNATTSKLRQALMLKSCIAFVENESTFNFFKAKYKINKKEQVSLAFYPSRNFSFKSTKLEDAVVEICISKGWQKI